MMRPGTLKDLHDRGFLTEDQFTRLHLLSTRQVVSVFYELRTLLYLGVLLFTSGMGILIYRNIGEAGHIASITGLFIMTVLCFVYNFRHAPDYSSGRITPPTPFFDYIVLFGCLLLISVLAYLQFQYTILDDAMGLTTLITSVLFFYAAYRFDHAGVLSLAITALASFWGISLSPQKWYSTDFFDTDHLYITGIVLGGALAAMAIALNTRSIKRHFTFTYINFASLMFLGGALAGIFTNEHDYFLYAFLLLSGCSATVYFAKRERSFLFLIYAFGFGYVGLTFILADSMLLDAGIWFTYLLASCAGFVFFIIRFKDHFKRAG